MVEVRTVIRWITDSVPCGHKAEYSHGCFVVIFLFRQRSSQFCREDNRFLTDVIVHPSYWCTCKFFISSLQFSWTCSHIALRCPRLHLELEFQQTFLRFIHINACPLIAFLASSIRGKFASRITLCHLTFGTWRIEQLKFLFYLFNFLTSWPGF